MQFDDDQTLDWRQSTTIATGVLLLERYYLRAIT